MFDNITRQKYFKKCGIYVIFNDSYYYIGQTINLYKRLNMHKNDLEKMRHGNPILQNIYTKYNNLQCEVILECDRSELTEHESYYITNYCSSRKCVNIQDPEKFGSRLIEVSEETKMKLKEFHLQNRDRLLEVYRGNLEKARKAVRQSNGWKGKKHKVSSKVKMSDAKKGKPSHRKGKKGSTKPSKPIYTIDEFGNRTDYNSAQEAAQLTGIQYKTLQQRIKYNRIGKDGSSWFYA